MALTASQKKKIRQRIGDSEREQAKNSGLTESELSRIRENFYRNDRKSPTEVDKDYIDTYLKDARNFAFKTGQDYKLLNYKSATAPTTGSYLDTLSNVESDLKSRGRRIQEYLYANRGNMDSKSYESMRTSLDSIAGGKSVVGELRRAVDSLSKFESEEAYKKFEAYSTTEGRQKRYAENQKKLDDLKAKKQELLLADADRYAPVAYTDTGLPIFDPFFNPFKRNTAVEDIDKQIAAVEAEMRNYERGNTDENGFYYGSKVVDDYSKIEDSALYGVYSGRRGYNIPTREDLNRFDIMTDSTQWYTDADNKTHDAFGTYIDPKNTDASGTIIHPAVKDRKYAIEDRLGLFLNAADEEKQEALGTPVDMEGSWETVIKDGFDGSWAELTQSEIGIYYTIRGTIGQEAADKYLADMKTELNRRQAEKEAENLSIAFSQADTLEKIALSLATVPAQALSNTASTIENAAAMVQGEDINPYSTAHAGINFSNTARSLQAEELDKTGIPIPVVDFTLGDAYQSVMSIADSWLSRKVVGVLGGGNLSNETISRISGTLLATGAASSEATRLYEQGASREQVFLGSVAAGTAEMVFESVSIEKLLDMKDAAKLRQVVANVLVQGGVEASEEGFTEIANIVTNAIIMGSQSDWQKSLDANGGDVGKAILDKTLDVIHAGIGGFISGFGSSAGPAAVSYVDSQIKTNKTGDTIIKAEGGVDALKALAMDVAGANTKITKQANKVTGEVATGKGLGKIKAYAKNIAEARRVGKLYQSVQQSVSKSNVSDIASVLEGKGYDPKSAKNIAEAVVAQMDGKELDAFQKGTLKAYAGDAKIDQAVEQLMNDTESAFAKRTGNMDTFNIGIAFGKGIAPAATQEVKSADIKVADDGKTKVVGGREIPIKFADNGQIATDNGAVIKVDDVEFSSNREGYVVEAISNLHLPATAANKLFDSIDLKNMTDAQAVEFVTGIQKAYELGRENNLAELPTHPLTKNLTSEQRMEAYSAGLAVRNKETAARQKAAAETKQKAEKAERKPGVYFVSDDQRVNDIDSFLENSSGLSPQQTSGIAAMKHLSKAIGVEFYVFKSYDKDRKRYYIDENGVEKPAPNGWYDPATGKIYIDLYAGQTARGTMLFTIAHELTHFIRQNSPAKFDALADIVVNKSNLKGKVSERIEQKLREAKDRREPISRDTAYEEVIADSMETILTSGRVFELMNEIQQQDKTLWEQIRDWFMDFIKSIREAYEGVDADTDEGQAIAAMDDVLKELEQVFAEGLLDAGENFQTAEKNTTQGIVNPQSAEDLDISADAKTESVAPSVLKSERTWKESDYVQERDKAAAEIAKAIGVTEQKAKDYIDSVNSIAKMIADDRVRLDYFSSPGRSSFVSNVEYGGSFDFSTLCKKRRLLTGTFTAIQKALPSTALTANEILEIRNRMKEANLEVSCGLCYVEGSRANMGQFAKEFLRLYKQYYPDGWQPNMADVNTPDGIEWVRINHPEVYEQYEYFWNHYGTLKPGDKNLFASQQKPKLYQLHTEYKGEILQKFNDDDNVEEKNLNGGIRLQSFSDFEIVHLIDTMQIIMDMSRVGLAGQAYTKVPDFAWALGDTGLKINLSLIAKGVDENGKLIFDDVEGMPIAEAMKLRDRYSKNVGTILVAFNDEQLMAAMADERVDFIIPFHRSQWKKSQYAAMGLPAKTKDYTFMQNEKFIKPQYHEYRGRMVKDKATNYMPNEYWDFGKTGKQNAEAYLEMCARNNKRPKFYKLLQNNGDGSYSLKADGSTDGYWKLLIDFKMYDNDGIGSPQTSVKPEFNMDEAMRMLNDYKGGHSNFPVAQGIVDSFVEEYKSNHPDKLYSNRTTESLSTRSILTNALEGVAQNEWEQNKLNEYKENIAKVEEMESRLQEINSQLYPYGKKMPQKDRIALQDEAVGLRNKITNIDKTLLRLEATKPLQNVLNRERARVRREMKQKAEERISEVKAEATQRLKRRSEGHAATEMRKKIRKTIRELDKILNRGDKKRNVKEDMKDFVTKATQSAELLFKESYPNEEILREGFQRVNLRPSEQVHYDEARKILEQIQTLGTSYDTIDEVTKLRGKLDYRISKLREAFDQERMLLNETEVAEVLNDLAGAYAELKNSEYSYIVEAYNEQVHEHLASLAEAMGGATIRSMTMSQLEDLYKAYRMVLETVRNSNKVFNEDIKLTRQQVSEEVIREILAQKKRNPLWSKAEISRNKFFWNNLKPIYATERVGSQTFSKVMSGLFEGQYKWATNVEAARNFQREISKKYKANGWDMNTSYAFTSSGGLDFELNLGQILSLYAYSKRDAAHDHITHGGIVFDKNTEVKIKENGIPVTRLKREATTYSISDEILGEILSKLTPEQKLFVDDMQKYLSETMGGLGNEVSMKLYGVKLFGEENYFPLKSAGQYMEKAREADLKKDQGHTSIVNAGFTHAVKPNAKNPIIINSFVDVWANHVNDMAMYNGMVLPMEDFRKVYNFHTPFYEGTSTTSVNGALENAFGSEAVKYFDQLYQELNSGAVTDPRESDMLKWVSKFKKASVMLSMSVVMQQTSAIGRAFALVDPKYFVGEKISENEQTKQWDELKKYAPVAIIKEMGGFDTHMGAGAKDYILDNGFKDSKLRKFMKKLDEISSYLPSKADEITWVAIWQAVKRETKATNPHLSGEEFFKKAGRRFSEVIEKTQVYDSVLARSANMRSKTGLMTMATAFMAEPTTTINMVELALRSKKNVGRVLASVVTSIVVNNFLASWIYAARDDDEDETFLEKYAQAFTSGLVDDLNPITYYPFVKDIWSLFQGYDVERGDMSVIADVSDALKKTLQIIGKDTSEMNEEQLAKHHAQTWDAILTLADGVASVCGIPAKNFRREFSAVINTVKTLTNGLGFSGTSLANAIGDSALDALPVANYLWMPDKADRLYTAIKNGDTDYVNRLKQEYGDDTKVSKAIQKGLKENDPRIYEAALKDIAGLPADRLKLQKEVMADGFSWEDVRNATVSIINKLTPDAAKAAPKKHGYYETDDFVTFVAKGQTSYANEAKKDIIATHQLNGKTEEEAIRSFKSSVSSQMKNAFNEGRVSASVAIHALVTYGEMDNTDATNKVESWKFEKEYGFQYGDRADAYKAGEISASELKKALTTVGGKTPAEADMQIKVYDWQKAGIDIDNDQTGIIKRYEEFCEAEGIDKRTYADFYKFYQESGEEGVAYSKTIECMPYIDRLSLSNKQKDALALSIWGESTVKKYKLW